jgi:anti-sigma B factor antagonist
MEHLFTTERVGDVTVVEFRTTSLMNPAELEKLSTALYELVDDQQGEPRRLLIDFTRVKYLSSQAIGIVITLHKKVSQREGGQLMLCGVGPSLSNLLKITRLDRILRITATQEEALRPAAGQ